MADQGVVMPERLDNRPSHDGFLCQHTTALDRRGGTTWVPSRRGDGSGADLVAVLTLDRNDRRARQAVGTEIGPAG